MTNQVRSLPPDAPTASKPYDSGVRSHGPAVAPAPVEERLRILAVAECWLGSSGHAFVNAFRRAGHSVLVSEERASLPAWGRPALRVARRALNSLAVRDFNDQIIHSSRSFRPDMLFVAKGTWMLPETVDALKATGTATINYYPDMGVWNHGPYLPKSLPRYDWMFTCKTFGIADMASQLGMTNVSYLPHGFDPDVHFPIELSEAERRHYGRDVTFVGSWSTSKEEIIAALRARRPHVSIGIWGNGWARAGGTLGDAVQGYPLLGVEYTKALRAGAICLGLMTERPQGASQGDKINERTFHVPASESFMIHQRTDEFRQVFEEDVEAVAFGDYDELAEKVDYYLARPERRIEIARQGRRRCVESGYSVDSQVTEIAAKARQIRAGAKSPGR